MKELYISPEVQVLCFAPVENLATSINFKDLWNLQSTNGGAGTEFASGDVPLPIN